MILLGTDDYKGLDCYLIHAEHVHVVDLLGVLDATRVTKHLRDDDYDQHHQGDHDRYHESHKGDLGDRKDAAPCNIRHVGQ